MEDEFKKSGATLQTKEDLLHLITNLNLVKPIVAKNIARGGVM